MDIVNGVGNVRKVRRLLSIYINVLRIVTGRARSSSVFWTPVKAVDRENHLRWTSWRCGRVACTVKGGKEGFFEVSGSRENRLESPTEMRVIARHTYTCKTINKRITTVSSLYTASTLYYCCNYC